MKLAARVQGKRHLEGFMDHLQLITPWRLTRAMKNAGLASETLLYQYVDDLMASDTRAKRYGKIIKCLQPLKSFKVHRICVWMALKLGLHPMILVKATKK